MQTSSIRLGFIGSYKSDLLQFLSRIFFHLNLSVAIVDASHEQVLKYSIPNPFEEDNVNYRGVEILLNQNTIEQLETIDFDCYDIILIDYGFNKLVLRDLESCQIIFAITDLQIHNIMHIKELFQAIKLIAQNKLKAMQIYRDVVDCKIKHSYIKYILQGDKVINIVDEYFLYLNEKDYRCKLMSQHDDTYKFKTLSTEYKALLRDIVNQYVDFDSKAITRAIKLAEEGE